MLNPTVRLTPSAGRRGDALALEVNNVLSRIHPSVTYERRRFERFPFPFLLRLVPLDPQGHGLYTEQMVVVGKEISQQGMSFFHQQPLACRRAILVLDETDAGRLVVEVDLAWCRFKRLGWYESGGRLIRTLDFVPNPASQAG
jgi:hypothetical protein